MLLSSYVEMAYPALVAEARHTDARSSEALPWRLAETTLPPTWRQVQRITTSSFIILIAYWKGELNKSEAARYVSMALLLLTHQSMRWGRAIDGCIKTLDRLASSSQLDLSRGKKSLLYEAGAEEWGASMLSEPQNPESSLYGCGNVAELEPLTGNGSAGTLFDDLVQQTWARDLMMW